MSFNPEYIYQAISSATSDTPIDLINDSSCLGIKIVNTHATEDAVVTLKGKTTLAAGAGASQTVILLNKVVVPSEAFLVLDERDLGLDTQFFTLFVTLATATSTVTLTLYF
jgi:hypothetical protein